MNISPIRKLSFPPERLEIKEEKTDGEGRRKLKFRKSRMFGARKEKKSPMNDRHLAFWRL